MPDLDKIPRGIRGSWRAPYRAMVAGRGASDVAGLLTPAITEAVRREGGWPWIGTLAGALVTSLSGDRSAWQLAQQAAGSDMLAQPSLRLAVEEGEAILATLSANMN
ncbi:MAG TPA: hypothetical protein VGU71_12005 [Candidatus Dormibacteraeota bacterium]|nr:hypothetical protein [Candidatus Dormibacteraeota bacterium]